MTTSIAFRYHCVVTGAQVKRIRQALGLTQQQFADRLGVHKVTLAKWETDAQGMRGPAARLIVLLGERPKGAAAGSAKINPGKPRATKTPKGAKRNRA